MDGIVVRVGARMSEVCRKRFHDLPTTIFFFISPKFPAYVFNAAWAKFDRKSFDT